MNRDVLVAVGGTGMRIAQSVVMMAASGLLADLSKTDEYELEIKMVDLDIVPEGDKDELTKIIDHYNTAASAIKMTKNCIWRPRAIRLSSETKNLFKLEEQILGKKLDDLIETEVGTNAGALLRAMFGEKERTGDTLDHGCNGKPRIGSLLLATAFEKQKSFWNEITKTRPSADGNFRIMFAGSLFGGTGASGVPTLARKFIDNIDSGDEADIFKHVGITLMLPYFSYDRDTKDPVNPFLFNLQSQMAIKYYADSDALEAGGIDFVQFVGDDCEKMYRLKNGYESRTDDEIWEQIGSHFKAEESEKGAKGQNDPSMPAELMAAIGICRFFAGEDVNFNLPSKNTSDIAAKDTRILNFNYFSSNIPVEEYVGRLLRLYLMLKIYLPGRVLNKNGEESYKYDPPLGVKQLYDDLESYKKAMNIVDPFLVDILRWLLELEKHGMEQCLRFKNNRSIVAENAQNGDTDFNLYQIPCSQMLVGLNNMLPGEDEFLRTMLNVCSRRVS